MKNSLILTLLLTSTLSYAGQHRVKVIYGDDNRVDLVASTNMLHVKLAKSTAAMIPTSKLRDFNAVQTLIGGETLEDSGICSIERFSKQPNTASCSGFLVGKNLLVTAGHCVQTSLDCRANSWVFDYKVDYATQSEVIVDNDSVYNCKKIISQSLTTNGEDYALVELDRNVEDREPLKFRRSGKPKVGDKLVVIGHPSGLPTKITDGANVRSVKKEYLVANLDTYGGNSGSAVFNATTGIVEGILVRGDQDYVAHSSGVCMISNRIGNLAGRGEDVTLIGQVKKLKSLITPPAPSVVVNPEVQPSVEQEVEQEVKPEVEQEEQETENLLSLFLNWLLGK